MLVKDTLDTSYVFIHEEYIGHWKILMLIKNIYLIFINNTDDMIQLKSKYFLLIKKMMIIKLGGFKYVLYIPI